MAAPVITKPSKQVSEVDVAVTTLKLEATNLPTKWTATPLPKGLTLNAAKGEISGTPTEAEKVTVKLHAENVAKEESAEVTFEWETTSQVITLNNGKEVKFVEPSNAVVIKQIETGRKGKQLCFITVYEKTGKTSPFSFLASSVSSIG